MSELNHMNDNHFFKQHPPQTISCYEEAIANDRRLEDMIVYKLTAGTTELPMTDMMAHKFNEMKQNLKGNQPSDENDRMQKFNEMLSQKLKFQVELSKLFKEFKNGIKRGEYTLQELEDKIYSEHGIISEDNMGRVNPLKDEEWQPSFPEEQKEGI